MNLSVPMVEIGGTLYTSSAVLAESMTRSRQGVGAFSEAVAGLYSAGSCAKSINNHLRPVK